MTFDLGEAELPEPDQEYFQMHCVLKRRENFEASSTTQRQALWVVYKDAEIKPGLSSSINAKKVEPPGECKTIAFLEQILITKVMSEQQEKRQRKMEKTHSKEIRMLLYLS